jgi:hypothetical protein
MTRCAIALTSLVIFTTFICENATAVAAAAAKPLTGGVTKTDIGVDLARFGVSVKQSPDPKFKAIVDGIKPGSPAYYAGMKSGDRILKAANGANGPTITFDRGGTTYGATLTGRMPVIDTTKIVTKPTAPAPVLTPEQKLQLIASRELVVIIDQTMSMAEHDCPGRQSRWEWCRAQTVGLMNQLSGHLKDITVVTFNDSYHVYPHAGAKEIADIFNHNEPAGGTNTAAPLQEVLKDYFRKRAAGRIMPKPLLIAVITDGLPNKPGGPEAAKQAVEDTIEDATRQMRSPDEVVITFLQIGEDLEGNDFLSRLDAHMPGRYDIVDTKTFNQVQSLGLKEALVDSLTERNVHASANNHLQQEIRDLTKQSRAIRQQLKELK